LDNQGIVPFARVVDGAKALEAAVNSEYFSEPVTTMIAQYGNQYLQTNFPNLTYISACKFETTQADEPEPEPEPEVGVAVVPAMAENTQADEPQPGPEVGLAVAPAVAEPQPEPEPESEVADDLMGMLDDLVIE
jgi:type IV secretory pathway VirB10-like protein